MREPLSREDVEALGPVGRRFYQRDTLEVAREVLGMIVIRKLGDELMALRIAEVEAYLGVADRACHTFGGRRTPRTEVMWGEAGHLYVYFTYGMHHCANVVTRGSGHPEAVLLRAGWPLLGAAGMTVRRGGRSEVLIDGPGKLCQALALDRTVNGCDLTTAGDVWLADDGVRVCEEAVARLPRVGVGSAGEAADWPLRLRVVVRPPPSPSRTAVAPPGAPVR